MRTALDVFRASAEKHAGEHYYSVALYTSGKYGYLVDTVSTNDGLRQVANKYLKDGRYQDESGTLHAAMKDLKWSPCDSPHYCEFKGRFNRANELLDSIWQAVDDNADDQFLTTCKDIHEICIVVLAKVRDSGIFRKDQVVFNLLMGDQSNEERLLNAEALNSVEMVDRFRSELEIDDDRLDDLRKTRWDW